MALLWLDSVDGYDDAAQITKKWSSRTVNDHAVTVAAEGRIENCLKWVTSASAGACDGVSYAPIAIGTASEGIFGMAVKVDGLGNLSEIGPSSRTLFSLWSGWGGTHLVVVMNIDGTLALYRTSTTGNTYLQKSGLALRDGEWSYLEFDWKISHTVGTFNIYVNGIVDIPSLTYSGDTCANDGFGNSLAIDWTGIGVLYGRGPAGALFDCRNSDTKVMTVYVDDVYLLDKVDADTPNHVNDTAWGGVSLGWIAPDAVGTNTDWSRAGVDSGNNWDQVNDAAPDTADRIETDVVDEVDTYLHEDVGSTVVVKGVQLVAYCQKGDEGGNSIAGVIRSGGADYELVERGVVSNTAYNYATFPSDLNPDGDVAWTPTTVNLAEFGPKKTV